MRDFLDSEMSTGFGNQALHFRFYYFRHLISETIQDLSHDWLLLSIICNRISSFLRLNNPLHIYHISFIHLSIRHLGCFHPWAVVNNSVTMGVQIFLHDSAFNSFGYILRHRVPGSHSSSSCNPLRHLYIVFHSSCTVLQSHQQIARTNFPISSPMLISIFFFLFLVAILMGVK